MQVDLHSHSTHSDGTWTVKELLREAQRKKLKGFSITDHDTLAGSYEAETQLQFFSGSFFPGTELSVEVQGLRLHVLAHFPSFKNLHGSRFDSALKKMSEYRLTRMKKMIEKAKALALPVTMEEVIALAKEKRENSRLILSRPHLARLLVRKGIVQSVTEAFQTYLNPGRPLYVPKKTFSLDEWASFTREANGLLTWAHPLYNLNNDMHKLKDLTEYVLSHGVKGLELYYKYLKYPIKEDFLAEANEYLFSIAKEHDLIITVGGDFHGDSGVLGEITYSKKEWEKFLAFMKGKESP